MTEKIFIQVLNMSLTASFVILAVLVFRLFLKRAPKIFSYLLWGVVLFRLLCPVSFSTGFSLLGAINTPEAEQGQIAYIPQEIGLMQNPEVELPVPVLKDAVNSSLPAATPMASVNPMQIYLFIGAWVWLLGIGVLLLFSGISYGFLLRRLKNAKLAKDGVYDTDRIETPFVLGIFYPRIYLPECLEDKERDYILLHEQIHIRRGDHVTRALGYLALCIHWFNPLVWVAYFLSEKDMEMSCDEAVIRKIGSSVKKDYTQSLLSLASGRRLIGGVPPAFGEGDTGSRIKNVLRYRKPAGLLLAAAAVLCLLAAVFLTANPRKKEEAFLSEFGFEIFRSVTGSGAEKQDSEAGQEGSLGEEGVKDLTEVPPVDGQYWVYARSISRSLRGIDRYVWDIGDEDQDLPELVFAEDCVFLANEEMDSIRYNKVSFDKFAELAEAGFSYLNTPVLATFEDGLIVEASLESSYYEYGISYEKVPADPWYDFILEEQGEDALSRYYVLSGTEQMDVADTPGEEQIEIYTGNIGDGDSGIVMVKDKDGELLYTGSAHRSRAGWNNIYLGELDGTGFILLVHIEDRDTYGDYAYHVFRLGDKAGEIRQIAGSRFTFSDGITYDDSMFFRWAEKMSAYLENSRLILSTQEGELRTEQVSEADKYNYETLRRR